MSADQILGLSVALLIMVIGFIGSFVPGIPSTPLVLAAAIGHKIYFRETGVGWMVMTILVAITVCSMVMDYLASIYGAKKLGATWRGAVGAVLGGIVGLFFAFPGLLIGPFLGAFGLEMLGGRTWRDSGKAGAGATLGLIAGALGKMAACLAMIGIFAFNVVYRANS
jgi:uncharacterized protein